MALWTLANFVVGGDVFRDWILNDDDTIQKAVCTQQIELLVVLLYAFQFCDEIDASLYCHLDLLKASPFIHQFLS